MMAVSVSVYGRGIEVGTRLQDHIEKKVGKLDRYLATIREARVDVTELGAARASADRYVAQLTIPMRGTVLRAEERSSDLFAAIDQVLNKMYRQIERYKGKHSRGRGDGVSAAELAMEPEETAPGGESDEEADGRAIVRRKQFSIQPMSEAEAVEQMELLGHDQFFVFYSAEARRINVLYRRRDGDFGLIDPIFD
jgi:putative sigma-54 modulation protein